MPVRPQHSLWASFRAAFAGLMWAWRSQRNVRIHCVLAVVACGAGWACGFHPWEWGLLILAIGQVLAAELLNTAVETVVDLASPEWHELAKQAKDTAAAGVLLSAGAAVGIGLVLFGPRLWLLWLGK